LKNFYFFFIFLKYLHINLLHLKFVTLTSLFSQMQTLQYKLNSTTFVATKCQATMNGLQTVFDCSGSMERYIPVLKSASVTSAKNGIRTILFSSTTFVLKDDVSLLEFPEEGQHFMHNTYYTPVFKALNEDDNVDPHTNVMFMTDGVPNDFEVSLPFAKTIHDILATGTGTIQFYYLGQPSQRAMTIMRALSFPLGTEPLVFTPSTFDEVMHKVMCESVPVAVARESVSTGIWRVTKLSEDEKNDAEDLTLCRQPEVALACVAAILNYMKHKTFQLSHEDSKHLNSQVLQKFSLHPGVVGLMDSVRDLAAESGSAGMSEDMAFLMKQANVVTGTVPTQSVIDKAVMALVRNPDPAYAQQSKKQREDRKAIQKVKARFADTQAQMSKIMNRAAKHTMEYMKNRVQSYRLSKLDAIPSAVYMNPPCLAVTCDGATYPFVTGGSDALLPVGCQHADYLEALVFNLLGAQIYTQNAPLALLNVALSNTAMLAPIVAALKVFKPFPGFAPLKATVPFMFDPEAISAAHFLFYPHFVDPTLVLSYPHSVDANLAEAFVHAISAIVYRACDPLPLDMSRVKSHSVLKFEELVLEFSANNCNLAELSKRAFPSADFDAKHVDNLHALRDQILASYKASPPAPEGIAPAVPELQPVLDILRASIQTLLPHGFGSMSGETLLDYLIVQAGLRVSVAASIGEASSAGALHRCEIDTTAPGRIRFSPSEEQRLQLLVSGMETMFVNKRDFGKLQKLEASPLLYLRLAGNNSESVRHVVSLIDWSDCVPTSAWPREALKCASMVEMAPHVNSAVAISNLEGTFNAQWFSPKDVAYILMTAENCTAKNVENPAAVLASILKKDARTMRNTLSLLGNVQEALAYLEVPEGGTLSEDQIALGRKIQGIDPQVVAHLSDCLKDNSQIARIMNHWLQRFHKPTAMKPLPTTAEIMEFFFRNHTKKNAKRDEDDRLTEEQKDQYRRVFNANQTAVGYYKARKALYSQGRAKRRTEVLGMLLQFAGEKI
jgi:hypothetical protein